MSTEERNPPTWPRAARGVAAGIAALVVTGALAAAWGQAFPLRPLHPVVVAWVAALVWTFPTQRVVLGTAALTVVVRALTFEPRIHMHFGKAYGLMLEARGLDAHDHRYGDAWPSLMGPLTRLVGDGPDAVHLVDAAISGLAPVLLAALVWNLTRDRVPAGAAGVILALLPLPMAQAPMEHRMVLASTLQVAALYGATREDRGGDLLAISSVVLLAHLRPLQLPIALLLAFALAARARHGAALLAVLGVGWRGAELTAFLMAGGSDGGGHLGMLLHPQTWWPLGGPGGSIVLADPLRTPVALPILAAAGAWAAREAHRREALWFAALAVLGIGLYLGQPLDPDRVRFQAPVQVWATGLAAVGLGAWWARDRALAVVAGLVLTITAGWSARPYGEGWVWQVEYRALRAALPLVPTDATVVFSQARGADLGTWAGRASWSHWEPRRGPVPTGALVWLGSADGVDPDAPTPDPLRPIVSITVPPRYGGMLDGVEGPVRLGLHRVGPAAEVSRKTPDGPASR